MTDTALHGLKILVTRPRDQAMQLAQGIAQAGGIALLYPLLEISAVEDSTQLQKQISGLQQTDLAIFISPNAVQYGMAAIGESGLPASLKVATVGAASAQALRLRGVNEVIVPNERFDSEGLLLMPLLQQIAGWRVMIFRGDGGRELLGDVLKDRGAMVEYVSCYHRSKPQVKVSELINADALTVTSSEALGYLQLMLSEAAKNNNASNKIHAVPLFVPHERIAELAYRQGWLQVYLTDAGDEGLLSGLMKWGRSRIVDSGLGIEDSGKSLKGNE